MKEKNRDWNIAPDSSLGPSLSFCSRGGVTLLQSQVRIYSKGSHTVVLISPSRYKEVAVMLDKSKP